MTEDSNTPDASAAHHKAAAKIAGHYLGIADELAEPLHRTGAFNRALSVLPAFLFVIAIAVYATALDLRATQHSWFRSSEMRDATFLTITLVVASTASYIAEIFIREAGRPSKEAVAQARTALREVGAEAMGGSNVPGIGSGSRSSSGGSSRSKSTQEYQVDAPAPNRGRLFRWFRKP